MYKSRQPHTHERQIDLRDQLSLSQSGSQVTVRSRIEWLGTIMERMRSMTCVCIYCKKHCSSVVEVSKYICGHVS